MSEHGVCPWRHAYLFDNWLRRLLHNPKKMLGAHVRPGMTVMDVGCGMGVFSIGMVADGDWLVDSADLAIWQQYYDPLGLNDNTFAMGDWNNDGFIDSADLALWQQYYDPIGSNGLAATHAPEPATVCLLAVGGLGVLMRRRKRPW